MSTRFVAPPPPPPLTSPSLDGSQLLAANNGRLPPPLHPALVRHRTPIPPNSESLGILNSSPAPRPVSPAPILPHRVSNGIAQSSADPNSSQNTRPSAISSHTPSGSDLSFISSETTSAPLLFVTPAGTTSDGNLPYTPSLNTDTLPPYASEPDLTPQPVSDIPESSSYSADLPTLDTRTQYHDVTTETPVQFVPPPLHPSRHPSPSPDFSAISQPLLRHRGQSSTSFRMPGTPITRPAVLGHARRGSGASILTLKDETLTDEDLRNMYDAEEVERYLRLFASRVNEVSMHPHHENASIPTQNHTDEDDWISLSAPPPLSTAKPILPPHLQSPSTPFEHIAATIYPYIAQPPTSLPAKRKFKLSRAAGSAQRLYLAAYPAYIPPLVHLARLSIWKDPKKSGFWCAVFWVAWAAGLLTPLTVGRVLYALLTGGTVTRKEIRRRREAAKEAEALGRAIEGGVPGMGISGTLSVWDVTKLVTGVGKRKQKKARAVIEEVQKADEGEIVLGNEGESEDPEDWKLMLVDIADELADLHERVKNIFLHRRPATTRKYTIALSILFIGTLVIQNTSKLITFTMGFFFWFIPPIMKHLPTLPPAFADAQTDAEVAMDLIAQRVARGERVVPERVSKKKKDKKGKERSETAASASTSHLNLSDTATITSPSTSSFLEFSEETDDETAYVVPKRVKEMPVPQEDKFRKGAVRAWNWLGKTKQLMDQVCGSEGQGTVYASPEQSFPAQHRSRPGMLMISPSVLTFSPLFAPATPAIPSPSSNVIKVDIDHLRGVKKVSPGGLVVRFVRGSEVVEERFLLVIGRDEAFATLVGWGGGKWKHV